ncbi:antigen 5 like allergen Cul n 1 isoform X1 [Bactrocera dorsalis]|uniref:Antigen 5 like allergen Cul n 1 isoform X1 n=1 Tax=Bactrocera dorsalis TaxID=27457 RepID=A0A034WIT5_BACDO|nr:antigen 5 like allergen Cul n 1 isoform X1 [Bactrocera dorsalis]XP_049302082.1 antigen 5 like allergen Cul n 1 isoform X1 [Bactrocera dorsalis]
MINVLNIGFYFVAFSIWSCVSVNAYYYCDKQKELCGTSKHFMCNQDDVPRAGELLGLLPLTDKIKRMYVDRHNEYRNKLAGGEQAFKGGEKFPKATRMREIIWDGELAYIAGHHAKRCNMKHDACRATERFPGSGQNLHIMGTSVKPKTVANVVVQAVDDWWSEYLLVTDGNKMVEEFPQGVADWHAIGHFSAIANERAAFVGCGLALCQNCSFGSYCIEVTCNYSKTNVAGTFMYKKGNSSASECDHYESVQSSKYPHLCENTGKIFKE